MADKLGQAASVMQVTGVDAFGLVSMIVQAAHTARRNRDLCRQLAQHVQIVGGLLRKLQIPELRRHPETRRPLEQLDDALLRAYKLVSLEASAKNRTPASSTESSVDQPWPASSGRCRRRLTATSSSSP